MTIAPELTVVPNRDGGHRESAASPEQSGTVIPQRPTTPPPPPRRLRGSTGGGVANVLGAGAAALSATALLFGRVAGFSGLVGFVIVAYVLFIAIYAALVALTDERQVVVDRVMTMFFYSSASLLCIVLGFIIVYTLLQARHALTHSNLYTQDLGRAGSLAPLTVGGIKHAFVGTLWMIGLAVVFTVPLGLTAAVYLSVARGPFPRFVRTIVEAMTALPSVVAGLFVFATWILILHMEKSALAASLALSVDMLPIIIRAADVVLRLVPGTLREASEALGAPSWRTTWNVVIPTARSGLATAVILGMARGIGETAPVLLTAGFTSRLNTDPLHGPIVSLPLEALELVRTGIPNMQARGFAAAAILLVLVVGLFAIARAIGGKAPGQLSKRQARRRARASTRDANRMIRRYEREGRTT
jgi:phosphate transport system permease protein